jgi:WD repeat-containing protein 35
MYECIVAGVLDYDYAPCSLMIGTQRVWMNITQEGKDDIDDLREGGLVNGLKLASDSFIPITAYQCSLKGLELLKILPRELKDEVDEAIHGPEDPYTDELLACRWCAEEDARAQYMDEMEKFKAGLGPPPEEDEMPGGYFELYTESGYARESDVTETEDVSYVSSPWLPECLRDMASNRCREHMTDNSNRAHESAAGESDIKDELSEAITLENVCVMVGEWVPFGSNTIVALNEKLSTADRCQGGMFTGEADKDADHGSYKNGKFTHVLYQPRQLGENTEVKILDYDLTECINFEASIKFPEAPGIVQVEEFGMHVSCEGALVYSMKIDAIQVRIATASLAP